MNETTDPALGSSQQQIDDAGSLQIAATYAESTNELRYLRYLEKLAKLANSVRQNVSAGECYKTVLEQLKLN